MVVWHQYAPSVSGCSNPTFETIGTFAFADGLPRAFAVHGDRLYGTFGGAGLRRFTYPGLVNIDGAGNSWISAVGYSFNGIAVDPNSGDVYYHATQGISGGVDEFSRVTPSVGTPLLITSFSNVGTVREAYMAWNPATSSFFALRDKRPAILYELTSTTATPIETFTDGVGFFRTPHVTPDGALWFIGSANTSPFDYVFRWDGTLARTPADQENYGLARCDNTFYSATYGGDWLRWSPSLTSTTDGGFVMPTNVVTFTAPGADEAWAVDADDLTLYRVMSGP